MNIVMNQDNKFIEIQGTAEGVAFSLTELNSILDASQKAINLIFEIAKK
jgi:ribonuclease PH